MRALVIFLAAAGVARGPAAEGRFDPAKIEAAAAPADAGAPLAETPKVVPFSGERVASGERLAGGRERQPAEPNNFGREGCVEVQPTDAWRWNDLDGNAELPSRCEGP